MRSFPFCLCLAAALLLASCTPKGLDVTQFGLEDAVIANDLAVFPQDLTVYAERVGKSTALMPPERQGREDARYDANFFAAWEKGVSYLPKDEVFEGVKNMSPAKGFAENLRPWNPERWQALIANCAMNGYGRVPVRQAITVTETPLRRMPTDAPYFLNPAKGGEGFPFDYMQNSALWVGTPVAVIHISRDGVWAFVQTRLVSGWARVSSLASVDKAFIHAWQSRPMLAIVQDNVIMPVGDKPVDAVSGSSHSVVAHVGTILPLARATAALREPKSPHVLVHVPMRSVSGKAVMATALAPIYAARQKPLFLTPQNLALVGNAMMGQPYGWGGLFSQRDCSAAMHDLFTPFGIWLPRNSGPQGKTGKRLDLAGLSPDQKEKRIARDGVPFFSLVGMPGHVGLYLGTFPVQDGKQEREVPVMFHNMWGLRVADGSGENRREGRGVIGKAVVTSLRPGAEHPTISSPASLLDRINGLAVLPEPLPGERQ